MSRPIAIDARLNAYRGGGIARSTAALIDHLAPLVPADELLVLMHRRMQRWPGAAVRTSRLWTPPHHRLEQWTLPVEVGLRRPAVLHSPDFIPPLRRTFASVITVHDVAFRLFPEILDAAARRFYGRIDAAVRSADAIIAVSHNTAADLMRLLDVPASKITVIHHGCDLRPVDVMAGEGRRIGGVDLIAGEFMAFVSTLEPRKNIPMLLDALTILNQRRPNEAYRLVLAGRRGWLDAPIFAKLNEVGDLAVFVEAPSDDDVRWLLSACRIYVNPSRYEGFGLPLLEAMACAAPCIASDASSLPEVAGDAALLVPPDDREAWADALERLWHDSALRADLSARALRRAVDFSWPAAAQQTLAVYRRYQ